LPAYLGDFLSLYKKGRKRERGKRKKEEGREMTSGKKETKETNRS